MPARSRQVARQGAQEVAGIGEAVGTGKVVVFMAFPHIPKESQGKVTDEVRIRP